MFNCQFQWEVINMFIVNHNGKLYICLTVNYNWKVPICLTVNNDGKLLISIAKDKMGFKNQCSLFFHKTYTCTNCML